MTLRTSTKPHATIINAALHHLSTSARSPHAGATAPTFTAKQALLKIGNEGKATTKKLGEDGSKKAGVHLGHHMTTTQNSSHLQHLGRRSGSVRHATGDGGWTKLD